MIYHELGRVTELKDMVNAMAGDGVDFGAAPMTVIDHAADIVKVSLDGAAKVAEKATGAK